MVKYVLDKIAEKYTDHLYAIFRIFVGLLFFQHGAQKLLGWFTTNDPVSLMSLMGFAGVVELFGGLFIALGLFTRYAAVLMLIQMAAAYFMAHIPNGYVPIMNKGELALMYFASALVLLSQGSRKWSLEHALYKREH